MKILHRFGYYLGGFAIGLVILAFFLNGRDVSCEYNYGPEARTLKNISTKTFHFSPESEVFLTSTAIDSTKLKSIIKEGDVVFSKSEPRKEPCGIYYVEGEVNDKDLVLYIENCDSIATLQSIKYLN